MVCADHGMSDLPPSRVHLLRFDDPLVAMLEIPPTGEPTVPYFHVDPAHKATFSAAFHARFGEDFALLSAQDAIELNLFGAPLGERAASRLGDFVAIAPYPAAIYYQAEGRPPSVLAAIHAGLRPEEMFVPLLLG
jgi:hypothetical protein